MITGSLFTLLPFWVLAEFEASLKFSVALFLSTAALPFLILATILFTNKPILSQYQIGPWAVAKNKPPKVKTIGIKEEIKDGKYLSKVNKKKSPKIPPAPTWPLKDSAENKEHRPKTNRSKPKINRPTK